MMLTIKPGVKLNGISPEMVLAAVMVADAFEEQGLDCTITSCKDGVHKEGSLHYEGDALDFRTYHVGNSDDLTDIVQAIRWALGEEFDVVLEKYHIHVEFDPE